MPIQNCFLILEIISQHPPLIQIILIFNNLFTSDFLILFRIEISGSQSNNILAVDSMKYFSFFRFEMR